MTRTLTLNPDRLFPAEPATRAIARRLYDQVRALPIISPGQTVNVGPIPLKVPTYYNEEHRLVMTVDSTNQVFESNESDNVKEAIYVLQKASCP